jgi:hypothetical protein
MSKLVKIRDFKSGNLCQTCLTQAVFLTGPGRGPFSWCDATRRDSDAALSIAILNATVYKAELFGPGHFVGLGLRLKSDKART